MKTKNIILGGAFILGGGLLYWLFIKKQSPVGSVEKPKVDFIPTKSDVVVESELGAEAIDPVLASTTVGQEMVDAIKEIAPKVITEEDKRKEKLAQYFRDEIVAIENRDCSNAGLKGHALMMAKRHYTTYNGRRVKKITMLVDKCRDKKANDLRNKESELLAIGYSYRGNGQILKVR